VVAWRVLGFGGKSSPLTYSRCARLASRTEQGMWRPSPSDFGFAPAAAGRIQMNVDGPAVTCLGSSSQLDLAFDLVILWWRTLGITLALTKGVRGTDEHKWIGTVFSLRVGLVGPEAIVTVPDAFARELADQLRPYASGEGHLAESTTERLLGKSRQTRLHSPHHAPLYHRIVGRACRRQSSKRKR